MPLFLFREEEKSGAKKRSTKRILGIGNKKPIPICVLLGSFSYKKSCKAFIQFLSEMLLSDSPLSQRSSCFGVAGRGRV